jgi:hypothetical protein
VPTETEKPALTGVTLALAALVGVVLVIVVAVYLLA